MEEDPWTEAEMLALKTFLEMNQPWHLLGYLLPGRKDAEIEVMANSARYEKFLLSYRRQAIKDLSSNKFRV